VSAFLRSTAVSFAGVELGLYLAGRGFSATVVGTVVAAGLAGVAASSAVATLYGDRRGRRRLLLDVALLSVAGAALLAFAGSPVALAAAAFIGMINGMGRDRGAGMVVEQAAIPSVAPEGGRTRAIAIYNVAQDAGHALGALLAGLPALASARAGLAPDVSHRLGIGFYAALLLAIVVLYTRLSPRVEEGRSTGWIRVSPESRKALTRLSLLFGIDSFAGGFLTTALLSYFFFERFGASEGTIAVLFAAARVANALSHLGAAWLAKRIGLVNTMVFTHIPSSVLLLSVAYVPSFPVAAALFLLREGLVEMDVPTRQSFVLAIVRPEERTFASGVTNLVRLSMWAVAPLLAGRMMDGLSLGLPLALGAAMKIAYDLLLWRSFRRVQAPA
jgi:MFS family permease